MNNSRESALQGDLQPTALLDKNFVANPFSLLARLRSAGPVVEVPFPLIPGVKSVWTVTRLEEVVQILKNKLFTVDPTTITGMNVPAVPRKGALGIISQSMLTVDEPDHRRLRSLVSKAFTPRYIQSLRPSIQEIADDLLDRVQEQGHMDLVDDYAFPLPINVISTMLGVPSEARGLIREFAILFADEGFRNPDSAHLLLTQKFVDYLKQLIEEKRKHPQDDLISQLIQAEEAGDRLSEQELISMIAVLIMAGHETTSSLISNGTLALFDYPDQMQRLMADPSLVPAAVEEFLRYSGPILTPTIRYAREEVELGGQLIPKGGVVLILLASANRDELQFTQPDEVDIARKLNHHVAFGQGIHVCLGAPLARLEGDIAFTTLLQRLPELRLAIPREDVQWKGNLALRGIKSLPITF